MLYYFVTQKLYNNIYTYVYTCIQLHYNKFNDDDDDNNNDNKESQ